MFLIRAAFLKILDEISDHWVIFLQLPQLLFVSDHEQGETAKIQTTYNCMRWKNVNGALCGSGLRDRASGTLF